MLFADGLELLHREGDDMPLSPDAPEEISWPGYLNDTKISKISQGNKFWNVKYFHVFPVHAEYSMLT